MFLCDKCGLCCTQLGGSSIYEELDSGDGVCIYYDDGERLCSIYDDRPLLCNVDRAYEIYFKDQMSKDEYYQLNYESCKKLKEKFGGDRDVSVRIK